MSTAVKCRDSQVELLRCVLMFLIVLYHSQMFGAWHDAWWNEYFHAMLIWHVPAFVAISGWYGIKFTWRKFARLWGLVFFYSVVGFAITYLEHGAVSLNKFRVDGGWFGATYLGLMLISPFLNAALERLRQLPVMETLAIVGLGMLMITLNWLPRQLYTGVAPKGCGGSTLVMLASIYVVTAVVRMHE